MDVTLLPQRQNEKEDSDRDIQAVKVICPGMPATIDANVFTYEPTTLNSIPNPPSSKSTIPYHPIDIGVNVDRIMARQTDRRIIDRDSGKRRPATVPTQLPSRTRSPCTFTKINNRPASTMCDRVISPNMLSSVCEEAIRNCRALRDGDPGVTSTEGEPASRQLDCTRNDRMRR